MKNLVNSLRLRDSLDNLMPNVEGQAECRELVADFQRIFDTPNDADLWISLIKEETIEYGEEVRVFGFSDNSLKEYCDVIYVLCGAINIVPLYTEVPKAQLVHDLCDDMDAMADEFLSKFTTQQVIDGFRRVHLANLSKLTKEGEVLRREDGKVMKSDKYKPADMSGIINEFDINTLEL